MQVIGCQKEKSSLLNFLQRIIIRMSIDGEDANTIEQIDRHDLGASLLHMTRPESSTYKKPVFVGSFLWAMSEKPETARWNTHLVKYTQLSNSTDKMPQIHN
jgi:hypothetical protein